MLHKFLFEGLLTRISKLNTNDPFCSTWSQVAPAGSKVEVCERTVGSTTVNESTCQTFKTDIGTELMTLPQNSNFQVERKI